MRCFPFLLSFCFVAAGPASASDIKKFGMAAALDPALQPALDPVPEQEGLPRVLLIGDSISIGYTRAVRRELHGRANVVRPPENCGPTGFALKRLDGWLGSGPWAVIHFNFGLHDLKYLDSEGTYIVPQPGDQPLATPEQYAANLRTIVARLKQTGAKLVFATTTPVPDGTVGRIVGSERAYNDAALAVMREAGVAIDDLCAFVRERPALQRPNNVHFTPEGDDALAHVVTAAIAAQLPAPPSP
jgi:acyl-CoA thioesterase-1